MWIILNQLAVLKVIDSNQYGGIPQSSTTIALIGMIHRWSIASDGNGAVIRSILFDYRKAFDFIDHSCFESYQNWRYLIASLTGYPTF